MIDFNAHLLQRSFNDFEEAIVNFNGFEETIENSNGFEEAIVNFNGFEEAIVNFNGFEETIENSNGFEETITIECFLVLLPLTSMVFYWFLDHLTIGFNGFQWLGTIGGTMAWFQWIATLYSPSILLVSLSHLYLCSSSSSSSIASSSTSSSSTSSRSSSSSMHPSSML